MLLRKLASDMDEESSRFANMKFNLEGSNDQVTEHFTVLRQ